MRRTYWFGWALVFLVVTHGLVAEELDMGLAASGYDLPQTSSDKSSAIDRFEFAFQRNAQVVFADQFRALDVAWHQATAPSIAPEATSAQSLWSASHALSRSILYGLHEATQDLPVIAWLNGDRGFLANFLRNSVESAEAEPAVPPDVSLPFSTRSWWRDQLETGAIAYGVRPFRTDPCAFVSWGLRSGSELLLATHVRYYCRDFADHKFEFCVSVPIARQLSVDFDASYQFGRHNEERKMGIRMLRALPGGNQFHLGVELRVRPELFAGISFPI